MKNIDKITQRIKGLLAQAADQEGTPEGDMFQAKAFELIAKYGVSQESLQDKDDDEMVRRIIVLTGQYTLQQLSLLTGICEALRCEAVGAGSGRKITHVLVFGKARNADRAELLFTLLNPHMGAGARRLKARAAGQSTSVMRRSYMHGFAVQVRQRLQDIEGQVTEAAGQALAVRDDAALAKEYMESQVTAQHMKSRQSIDYGAHAAGQRAANNMDLQQQRMGGRAALPR